MDFAASLRNLFKKRDFKDEVEKSLGQDKNFEKVLTDVFAVYAELGFFHQADWETTIIKSITNVNPSPQSDAYAIPDTGACTDYGAQTDPEAPSRNQRRQRRQKTQPKVGRRSGRVRWQAERYTYN